MNGPGRGKIRQIIKTLDIGVIDAIRDKKTTGSTPDELVFFTPRVVVGGNEEFASLKKGDAVGFSRFYELTDGVQFAEAVWRDHGKEKKKTRKTAKTNRPKRKLLK